ncbi:hypothetical protein EPA93_41085 [Ktedonosporobacter rubrisoli]|uniref:Uncharacterized protein n=1 Tax=Ktedonosporobacter rubrisoli TaxID=2509675 RepID=A0A4P6K3G9_KTERU|nr:hypothetical protein [Ktedonosporobacter rubrisoli]QBD82036.1 hypothetical protein EPA93_41085 [Ktedonosporobacter rubrisoli]
MYRSIKKPYLLASTLLFVLGITVILFLALAFSLPFSQEPAHIPMTPTPTSTLIQIQGDLSSSR